MKPTIAVVDDDAAFLALMDDILNDEGYAALLVSSASEAPSAVEAHRPDLVILDVRFGNASSGWKILDDLRCRRDVADIPVVVCSADSLCLHERAQWLQEQGYISLEKPFRVDDLLTAIDEVLAAPRKRAA